MFSTANVSRYTVVKVTECIEALEGGQVAFRMTTGCDHWSTVMQVSHDNLLT